jgi:hypothetical protein
MCKKIELQLHNTMKLHLEPTGTDQTTKCNTEKVEVDFQVTRQQLSYKQVVDVM